MIETTITCDNCHREKQETNKWWVVNGEYRPTPIIGEGSRALLYMMPYSNATEAEIYQGALACSRECAHKIIEQWMEKTEAE